MTIPTCAVACVVHNDDGTPAVGASITATLNRFEIDPDTGYVVPRRVEATTDANGEATLDLWPNALGTTESSYTVKITAPNGKRLTTTASVPNTAYADLHAIAEAPLYEGKSDAQIVLANAVNAAAGAVSAQNAAAASAQAAAASAQAASNSAATASSNASQAGNYATAAGVQATAAQGYNNAASASATSAQNYANAAQSSATSATNSAVSASNSATSASNYANAAANSANAAVQTVANAFAVTDIYATATTTIPVPDGIPTDGQRYTLRIKDNGTPRNLVWSVNSFRAIGVTLPNPTAAGKLYYVNCIFNATDAIWDVVSVAQQA